MAKMSTQPKFSTDAAALSAGMALVCEAVERRNTIPILSNVKVVAADGAVTLFGTDLDNELAITIPADVQSHGISVPPAHSLRSVTATLGGNVECAHGDNRFVIRSGAFELSLCTLHPNDYPTMRMDKAVATFSLPAAVLRDTLQGICPAYSTDELRFYLNGAFMQPKDGALRFVATDGHKLMCRTIPLPTGAEKLLGSIIHRTCIRILLAAIAAQTCGVKVDVGTDKIRFSWPGGVLISKLIDGKYPEVDRVIPTNGEIVASFDGASLKSAIARIRSFPQVKDRAIVFKLEEGSTVIGVNCHESGNASERVDATLTGKPLEVGLNNAYIDHLLPDAGGVRFTFIDASSPVRIDYDGTPEAFSVLMPMPI